VPEKVAGTPSENGPKSSSQEGVPATLVRNQDAWPDSDRPCGRADRPIVTWRLWPRGRANGRRSAPGL